MASSWFLGANSVTNNIHASGDFINTDIWEQDKITIQLSDQPHPPLDAGRLQAFDEMLKDYIEELQTTYYKRKEDQMADMTQGNFELIAGIVNKLSVSGPIKSRIAEDFADALAPTNSRFKRAKFIQACVAGVVYNDDSQPDEDVISLVNEINKTAMPSYTITDSPSPLTWTSN